MQADGSPVRKTSENFDNGDKTYFMSLWSPAFWQPAKMEKGDTREKWNSN